VSSPSAAAIPAGGGASLSGEGFAKFVHDTWLVFQRQMLLYWRNPTQIAFSFAYPITMLLIFAPMMAKALYAEGVTNHVEAYRIYVPGQLSYTVAFGGLATGFVLLADVKSGIIERQRVTPTSRMALVFGRALREAIVLLFQVVLISILALPSGVLVQLPDLLVAYVLLTMIGMLTIGLSYGVALRLRNAAFLGPIQGAVAQPVMLVSGMLLPLTLAPLWMIYIARENPFYWGTNGVRALYADHLGDSTVWVSLLVVLAAGTLCLTWAMRQFARSVR
jgi:ABC-2 type transport system permease protein